MSTSRDTSLKLQVDWMVRVYNGSSWTVSDDFVYSSGNGQSPSALVSDSLGNIYAGGVGTETDYSNHWLVRKYSAGSWTGIQDYQLMAGASAGLSSLAWDPAAGKVYGTGYTTNNLGLTFWTTQSVS